ncbi:MAG: RHS repeat protein [Planctomycetes bacterium]|nr:RHS repeat protein [Planctomycetota bacterium]
MTAILRYARIDESATINVSAGQRGGKSGCSIQETTVALEAPMRAEQRFDYAPSGNLNFHADELGRVVRTFFDHLDRPVLVERQDPDGPGGLPAMTTGYQYDAAGNVVTVVDTAGTETAYQYTPQGWVKSVTRGANTTDSAVVEWEYDKIGRLKKETTFLDEL